MLFFLLTPKSYFPANQRVASRSYFPPVHLDSNAATPIIITIVNMATARGGGAAGGNAAPPAAPAGQQQVYSFPLLPWGEILACVHEMRVPVAADELGKGEPAAVRRVLEVFIESIMGATREELNQPKFTGISALQFPDLHAESIPELAFFRAAKRLLSACGVDDFTVKDVLAPTPRRVRRQLSALINFAKFREERLAAFSELTKESDRLLKHKAALQDENAALQAELDRLLQEQRQDAPALQQLVAECDDLKAEIYELNKQQAVLRHEAGELKQHCRELRDEIVSVDFYVAEEEETIQRLRAQIVTSPDRVRGEVAHVAEQLEKAKEELHRMESRHRELLTESDTFARAEKDVLKTLALMDEAEQEMRRCKDAKEQVKLQKKEIADVRRRTMETIAKRKRLEKTAQLKKDEIERYKEEARVKDQAAEQALQISQQELSKLESTHRAARQVIDNTNAARRELERKTREEELNYQKELNDLEQVSYDSVSPLLLAVLVSLFQCATSLDVFATAGRCRVLQSPGPRGHSLQLDVKSTVRAVARSRQG